MKQHKWSRYVTLLITFTYFLVSSFIGNVSVIEALDSTGVNRDAMVEILDWNINDAEGNALSETNKAKAMGQYQLSITFKLEMESGLLSEGDHFSLPLPKNEVLGAWSSGQSAEEDFMNDSGEIIGKWKISNGRIVVTLTEGVNGSPMITGTLTSGKSAISNSNVQDIVQNVSLIGEKNTITKLIGFEARKLVAFPTVDVKYSSYPTNNSMRWNINVNNYGLHELGKKEWGQNFTIKKDTVVEDTLQNKGKVTSVKILAYMYLPVSLDDGKPSNIGQSWDATRFFKQVSQQQGENYDEFYSRLQALEYGVYEENNEERLVVKFGDIGNNKLTYDMVNANAVSLLVNYAITNKYYDESQRDSLINYLSTTYGEQNIISGEVAKYVVMVDAKYNKVIEDTEVENIAQLTMNGLTKDLATKASLQGIIGSGTVEKNQALLFLQDQETGDLLENATFKLQSKNSSGEWIDQDSHPILTTSQSGVKTNALGYGEYRFVQLTKSNENYDLPNSNGYDSTLNTVVSSPFSITSSDAKGHVIKVENIMSYFTVTYTKGLHGTFEDNVHSDILIDSLTPEYSGLKDSANNPVGDLGYTFKGWSPLVSPTVTKNITYVAQWDIDTFTITYESNGGSTVPQETVDSNQVFMEPTNPTKDNHSFKGWYVDESLTTLYDFTTPATQDITVYAKWDKLESPVYPIEPVEPETSVKPDVPVLPATGLSSNNHGLEIILVGSLLILIRRSSNKRKRIDSQK